MGSGGYGKRKKQFPLRIWHQVVNHSSVGNPTLWSIQTTQTGLGGLFKKKKKKEDTNKLGRGGKMEVDLGELG